MSKLKINGSIHDIDAPPDMPLLWVLRDELGLTGTKYGCGMALCGACTVHLDGQAIRACTTPLSATLGKQVSTIERMERDRVGKVVQQAWIAHGVAQCGYCQAGQIMSATALLKSHHNPTEQQIDEAMAGNLCRCGSYPRIRLAIHSAAAQLRGVRG